jgi:hypothetical protein
MRIKLTRNLFYWLFLLPGTAAVIYLGLNAFKKEVLEPVCSIEVSYESTYDQQNQDPNPNLIPFEDPETHLFGYRSPLGEIVIGPKFTKAFNFSKWGIADVYMEPPGKFFRINQAGDILVQAYLDDNGPDYFVGGLSRFVENNQIGFIDQEGHQVIPAQFDWAAPFGYSLPITVVGKGCQEFPIPNSEYRERKCSQWGAIDKQGNLIVPLAYDHFTLTKQVVSNSLKSILTFHKGKQAYQLYYNTYQRKYTLKKCKVKSIS